MKRRNFLKIAGISSFVVNGHAMRPFSNTKMARLMADCEDVEDRVLVLIQLKGGNDGVNTVIPFPQYDAYADLRPVIKIPETGPERFIKLDNTLPGADQVGLHPVMTGFKALYDKGWLNIVQAVGYESLNQSHFKSTDLWLSGGDGTPENSNIRSGWMGRALNAMYPDVKGTPIPDMLYPLGIQIGDPYPSLGFHTETEHQNSINLYGQDPDGFYSLVQTIGGAPLLNVPDSDYGDELRYIMGVEDSVDQYSQYITQAFNAGSNAIATYPQTGLADQLKTVARLIKGGCKTKIYLCSMGGFDTHGSQIPPEGDITKGRHADLLRNLSDSLKVFYDDLDGLGLSDKVVSCTFSEFGRCARENGSAGTDHGTLAPMFIIGKALSGGVHGTNVDLVNLAGDNQLQGQQFDYRQVFTTLLQDWLGASNYVLEQTMFEGYVKMPVVGSAYVVAPDCYIATSVLDPAPGGRAMRMFPNPASHRAQVSFQSATSFDARLSVHSLGGALVSIQQVQVQAGANIYHVDVAQFPPGAYFVRLENTRSGKADVVKLSVAR
ncbi:MAG: DUF1501 domain-containing protein [Saprospirales bacterium]|nr:DUF1501 domain-containing protein [Saprospirales bacterium]MBK8920130.1 DUF1501 domain-containing protein [Saprospirales bacterium]